MESMASEPAIPEELIQALRAARAVAVLTGAGVSAESGVPTFRDAQTGLWSRFNPQDLATRAAFEKDPKRVWEWYAYRKALITHSAPNPAHYALAEMEFKVRAFTLVTQNIDGLHQQAGSRHVIELHGNIRRTKCFNEDVSVTMAFDDGQIPPRCPRCGGYLRPDVVWFGELLATGVLERAFEAATSCDVFLSVGTSGVVEPAASLPFEALSRGAVVVEINPETTPLSRAVTFRIEGPAGAALPQLVRATWGEEKDSSS